MRCISLGFRRPLLALATAILLLAPTALRPPAAAAQAPDPRIFLWLHDAFVEVQTASTNPPSVRVQDSSGRLKADVVALGPRSASGWRVNLSPEADLYNRVLLRPGDRVEVRVDGESTRLMVPEMSAWPDDEADLLRGRAPAGSLAVFVQLHRDPAWFDSPDPALVGPLAVAADGTFSLAPEDFDFGPGTWGEAAALDAAGHLTVFPFASPAATVYTTEPFALVRATPPERPVLSMLNDIGAERFRSGPAFALGGSLFLVLMAQDGIVDNGAYQPAADDVAAITQGASILLQAPLPRVLATVSADDRRVEGIGPPGARTLVQLEPAGPGSPDSPTLRVVPDVEGRISAHFPTVAVSRAARTVVMSYPGLGVARVTTGRVPNQRIRLYDNAIAGSIPGWDAVEIRLRDAAGALQARAETRADAAGAIEARLLTLQGRRVAMRPGDRVEIRPALGRGLDLTIPNLSAEVDAARLRLTGRAPPGAMVAATVFSQSPPYFSLTPYEADFLTFSAASDAEGRYTIPCQGQGCAMRYGQVGTRVGDAEYILDWLDTPLLGLGVSVSNAIGWGTAGLPVKVTPYDREGRPGAPIEDLVRPALNGGLPALEVPLVDPFPDGLAAGDRVDLSVGELSLALRVPVFSWLADTPRNIVSGTGPPGRAVTVLVSARNDLAGRPVSAGGSVIIDLDGRWSVRFASFDLRAGDAVELYLIMNDHFMWWNDDSIPASGPEPTAPPPTTVSPTTVRPTPIPLTRTPTPSRPPPNPPSTEPLFLPALRKGA